MLQIGHFPNIVGVETLQFWILNIGMLTIAAGGKCIMIFYHIYLIRQCKKELEGRVRKEGRMNYTRGNIWSFYQLNLCLEYGFLVISDNVDSQPYIIPLFRSEFPVNRTKKMTRKSAIFERKNTHNIFSIHLLHFGNSDQN